MTDQTPESIRYDGEGFSVIGAEPGVFSPWDYGIWPESICSSNWSGYNTHYAVRDGVLYLNYLTVGHIPRRGPPPKEDPDDPLSMIEAGSPPLPLLNGVEAQEGSMGYWDYNDIDMMLDYTGTLTVANGDKPRAPNYKTWSLEALLNEPPPPSRKYLALTFEHGKLVTATPIDPPPSEDYFEL